MNGDKNLTSARPAGQPSGAAPDPPGEPPVSCLVVDDDGHLRHTLCRILERFGYHPVPAASGAEALEILGRQSVPVVLTDVRMPEMDGVKLLETIRERWPEVGVVMASAVSEVDVAVSCLRMGALDYITKPFQLEEVSARISQALDKRRLILENRKYQTNLESMVQEQARRIEELFLEGITSLAHALDAKDSYTRGHSARVAAYAAGTARVLGLAEAHVQLTQLGAELHDIGKIGVNEGILWKPAKLTKEEYEHLMTHTVIGARILADLLKNAPEALAVVRSHHERLDGTGFPEGLEGDQIPIHVRIVSVVDSFDAMTTARPYRAALTEEEAFAELRRCAGVQFDPQVVEAFRRAFPPGTKFPLDLPESRRRHYPRCVVGSGRFSRISAKRRR